MYLIMLTICLNSFMDTNHLRSNVYATEHNSCLLLISLALLPPSPRLFEAYLQSKIDQTCWPVEEEKVFGLVVIKCKYLRYSNVEINIGVELRISFPPSYFVKNNLNSVSPKWDPCSLHPIPDLWVHHVLFSSSSLSSS